MKISKFYFYELGGFAHPKLYRKQLKNGQWAHFLDKSLL